MAIKNLPLSLLEVNRANDRHGELENETAAIAWLFNEREQHMRNLTKDIVDRGEIYEVPLVSPERNKFVVVGEVESTPLHTDAHTVPKRLRRKQAIEGGAWNFPA